VKGDSADIIVMDLEWTSWEGARKRHWSGPGEEMEIVQIGAVKLADRDGLPEIDAFEVMVRPRINPRLDPYFISLTEITQARLDREGIDLKPALNAFTAFVGDAADFYGFGDELWYFENNCQLYGLANPLAGRSCGDVRTGVLRGFDSVPRGVNSSDLPKLLGFQVPGTAHQGLSDSRCVAEALRRLRRLGKF